MISWPLFISVQCILIITIMYLLIQVLKFKRVINLEKRILRFSVNSITYKPDSFFDKLENKYKKLLAGISKIIGKSKLITNHSKKYEKYIDKTKIVRDNELDIISNKIVISVLIFIIMVISDIIRMQQVSIYQILFSLILGFFIPDLFMMITHNRKKKKVEEDFLPTHRADTRWCTCFHCGRWGFSAARGTR